MALRQRRSRLESLHERQRNSVALTLFYYDQRIRHEGYDIERMMDSAGLNAPATPPSGEAQSAPAGAVEGQA